MAKRSEIQKANHLAARAWNLDCRQNQHGRPYIRKSDGRRMCVTGAKRTRSAKGVHAPRKPLTLLQRGTRNKHARDKNAQYRSNCRAQGLVYKNGPDGMDCYPPKKRA